MWSTLNFKTEGLETGDFTGNCGLRVAPVQSGSNVCGGLPNLANGAVLLLVPLGVEFSRDFVAKSPPFIPQQHNTSDIREVHRIGFCWRAEKKERNDDREQNVFPPSKSTHLLYTIISTADNTYSLAQVPRYPKQGTAYDEMLPKQACPPTMIGTWALINRLGAWTNKAQTVFVPDPKCHVIHNSSSTVPTTL
jgi:hypothetical protein